MWMQGVGGKLLTGIYSMNVNSLACVRVKWGGGECFRTESDVREGCVMSPWLYSMYMDAVMKRDENGDGEDGS